MEDSSGALQEVEEDEAVDQRDDLLLLDDLDRQSSKLRQENAIYRDRCRTLRSEKDAALRRVSELGDTLLSAREECERLNGELFDARKEANSAAANAYQREEQESSPDAEEDDDVHTLRRKLRRAREELSSESGRLQEAEDEIDHLTTLLRVRDNEAEAAEEERCRQLEAMEQVLRAKDAALAAAREEAAELRAKAALCADYDLDGRSGPTSLNNNYGLEAQLRRRLDELERENARLRMMGANAA